MKIVPITGGIFAKVDDADFEMVSRYKWRLMKGAAVSRRPFIQMHRLITSAKAGEFVDHKNHDPLDNRRANLRKCSRCENMRNQKVQTREKHSKFKGVTYCVWSGRWKAQLKMNGVNYHLGRFNSQKEAADAYDKAAIGSFGQFAFTNHEAARAT